MANRYRTYQTDVLIVGSGAGAVGLVVELVKKNCKVLVVEQGNRNVNWGNGIIERGKKIYQPDGFFPKSKEGVVCYRHIGVGGTVELSCGNGLRPSRNDLLQLGIHIDNELDELNSELMIKEIPETHIGENTKQIMSSAQSLGFDMKPMPKFINFEKCKNCALCEIICRHGAKWSTKQLLESFESSGDLVLLDGVKIESIEIKGQRALAALGSDDDGIIKIASKIIVIAAGGIGTPIILQNSGIKAGSNLFLDLYVVIYGRSKAFTAARDMPMAAFYQHPDGSLMIAPYLDLELWHSLSNCGMSKWFGGEHFSGLMIKIADKSKGRVNKDGSINKNVYVQDVRKINMGVEIAKKILLKSGASEDSIALTQAKGAHPGGTASVRKVVDNELRVKGIKNLFVADASVFPTSPGRPPILAIMALAKHLGKLL